MNTSYFYRSKVLLRPAVLTVAVAAMLFPFAAHAAPTVEGMTIVMPEDGWYQVQDRSDYSEICAGVYSCEVPAGSYNVINHSTGERFRIAVSSEETASSEIVVTGNVISWSQAGWHQVQNAVTYESICEGGSNCIVEPGRYKVINHSTGETWSDINVSAEQDASAVDDLRYERYSSSAVELFWSHLPSYDSENGYTIYQDGRSIGRTFGTSYFIRDLPDESSYELDVRQAAQSTGSTITVPADGDEVDPPVVDVESALELASRIDIQRFEEMIADVEAATSAAEYNAENYLGAISAVAEASEARLVFERFNFLNLLERQVMNNDSSLGFTRVRAEDFSNATTFNREHSCSDGGSYLAVKYTPSDTPNASLVGSRQYSDLAGEYRFNECRIGDILIDGGYSAQLPIRSNGIDALVRLYLDITGVDGGVTSMSSTSFQHQMAITDEGTIDAAYEGITSPLESVTTVTVPSGGSMEMEVSVGILENALLNGAAVNDSIPADSYGVSMSRVYIAVGSTESEIWAYGELQFDRSDNPESPQEVDNYSTGNVEYLLSPRTNSMILEADNGDPTSFNTYISSSAGAFSDAEEFSVVSFVDSWNSGDFKHWTGGERFPLIWPPTSE